MEQDRAPERAPGDGPWQGSTRELASALRDLATRLRTEQGEWVPHDDPVLGSASSWKRTLKSIVFRSTRLATRRYDRLSADLATVAAELAYRLAEAEEETRKARGDYERLELTFRELPSTGSTSSGSAAWSEISDEYYWAFEQRMRGSS